MTIRYERGADGVVVLTLDDPSRGVNTMNEAFLSSLDTVLDRLEAERADITGVIITSAKQSWFAGGDLDMLGSIGADQAELAYTASMRVKAQLRRLETLGRPVVAAINGTVLGGGLELALACHHRVVADDRRIEIGCPEVTLGLLPAGGGVVRTVRLLGITEALLQVLLKGQRHRPPKALEIGLVHQVVPADQVLDAARAWVAANPDAVQPWDVKGYRIPGGTPSSPAFAANLPAFPANLRKELKGAPYPAPRNILAAAVEGAQVDLATAFDIEARYFAELVTGQVAKNMIQAFFFDLQAANARGSSAAPFTTVAVLGAGMMGAGIAYVCARAGMRVLLKDVTVEAAERGKAYSRRLVDKGRGGPDLLDRITPTADPADLVGADLVIEAVFEDPALKHKVFAEIQDVVAPDALLCSNTSTLPITELADGVRRQADFVGLHFFSPVDKMPLVEVIRGRTTSDDAVERALGVVRQLRKTPIVVNDSRGFFTSRVIGTFTNEGVAMLAEGIPAPSIEQASAQAGYPAPVLQLMDELTLTLPRKIRRETAAAVSAAGGTWTPHPADAVIDRMIDEFGRPGRSGGAGFYEYADGRRTRLWPGLREHFAAPGADLPPLVDLQERMLFAEALESVKCLDEGVLTSVADANIGSIFGIGFPGWTGGVLQYINGYPGGLDGFVARARELAARYGSRFEPPRLLLDKATRGELFR
ncbi:enoyl-CoA hydratase/isomerase family protein [Dactylosporangium aurantiacum]|uniref:Enoyl-CoA hydratase/isomerase family protein n=1 Tax=Dactylosporangium aurantiacum TaxID=35754 RepID=A0A9Q9I792_9ACTN|nr:3-hydroxyacyl-CoA dehydrogenase NAD-binding domain-containing protein [Dactylosporangium aurantiacum]MDG6107054.1 3-hydroxyacyl-CoA dehydrogenase NAD-binding domain-containing protein [Dactylosporangium aurantiacum]UWZ50597.1 enoyl-CoA hydratase/isomerase family protein [Dactylosporangium aurantiacum]